MSRMSAPYKLRNWAICMIWANIGEFCFLSNFDALKPRIIILRPEMGSTPPYESEMTYQIIVFIRFFVNFSFQNGRWWPSWILPILKNAQSYPKLTRQILKVDILGYKNQSLKAKYTKIPGLAKKSCLALRNYFFILWRAYDQIFAMTLKPFFSIFTFWNIVLGVILKLQLCAIQ